MRTKIVLMTLFMSFTMAACDSGLFYVPKKWTFSGSQWTNRYGVVELRMWAIGNLTEAKFATLEMSIENHSLLDTIVVKSALLETGNGTYSAEIRMGQIGPGRITHGSLFWDFKEPIREILAEPVALSIILKIGEKEKLLDIRFIRFH